MPARLTIYFSDRPSKTFIAENSGEYVLGRDPACDVVLDDGRVSRRHAELIVSDAGAEIRDLASKNGTAIDGALVDETRLPESCWLSVGGLLVQCEAGAELADASLEERRRREATLHEHRALAEPGLDVGTLVRRLLVSFVEMSGTDRGFVLLAGAEHGFRIVASQALSAEAVAEQEFSGSVSTVEKVLAGGRPLIQSDAREHDVSNARPSIVREGIRALVCVPLCAAGRTLGAVYADSRRPGKTFSELDVEILTALASHAALAMWASGLQEELEGLSRGLPTRIEPVAGSTGSAADFPAWSEVAAAHRNKEGP